MLELREGFENEHFGECECDIGEYAGDQLHEWDCELVACLLGECKCEEWALTLLEEDADRYLEESDPEQYHHNHNHTAKVNI